MPPGAGDARRTPGIRRRAMLAASADPTESAMPPIQPSNPAADLPLIALHCSGAGGQAFETWRRRLGGPLIAPDLLGSAPGDAWPRGEPTSLDAESARLEPLLPASGAHLFGHSYGGAVALQLALRQPQRVCSLTLYEPVRFALLRETPALWEAIVAVGRRIGTLTLARRDDEAAELFVDYWSQPGRWAALPPARRAALAARMPKVRAEFEALFNDRMPAAAYAGLPMPVHLIVGGRSPAPARQVADRLAAVCGTAWITRLPGQGHMAPLEDPGAVIAQLPWARAPLAEAA